MNVENERKLNLIREFLIDDIIEQKQCEAEFYEFVKASWHILDPNNPLIDNWHIEYICKILQAEAERIAEKKPRSKHLNINISPRTAKSNIVSVGFPAWCWTRWPWMRFICASHTRPLTLDLATKSRDLIESEWYQNHWGAKFKLRGDQNAKEFYQTEVNGMPMGYRKSTYVGGKITGRGADIIIQDDLLDVNDRFSVVAIKNANDFHTTVLQTRLDNQKIGIRINIQQRVVSNDVTGLILKDPHWNSIIIPARLSENVMPESLKSFYDESGLFFPNLIDEQYLESVSRNDGTGLSRADFQAQYMQKPADEIETLYHRNNWRFYRLLPAKIDETIISADFSFKKPSNDKKKKSFTVIQVWSKSGANCYLRYQWRRQCGYTEAKQAFLNVTNQFKEAKIKLVEDKANGSAILDELRNEIPGLKAIEPDGTKYERAQRTCWVQESGNQYLPDPQEQPWVLDFMEEHALFKGDDNEVNDQVDTQTQSMDHFYPSKKSAAKAFLKAYGRQ